MASKRALTLSIEVYMAQFMSSKAHLEQRLPYEDITEDELIVGTVKGGGCLQIYR